MSEQNTNVENSVEETVAEAPVETNEEAIVAEESNDEATPAEESAA